MGTRGFVNGLDSAGDSKVDTESSWDDDGDTETGFVEDTKAPHRRQSERREFPELLREKPRRHGRHGSDRVRGRGTRRTVD